MPEGAIPAYITSLIRHFEDLRDGTHGGSTARKDKAAHFEKAVQLLAPIARRVLNEMNTNLLLDTGQLTESGLRRTPDGGLNASWTLSWPEQRSRTNRTPSLLRRRFPPPSSSRHDSPRLAVECVQRRGCRGPTIHTPRHSVQRYAQFGLPLGLSDRSCGHGKSCQPAQPWSQSNLISAMRIFS
jgi:hypothetical protein